MFRLRARRRAASAHTPAASSPSLLKPTPGLISISSQALDGLASLKRVASLLVLTPSLTSMNALLTKASPTTRVFVYSTIMALAAGVFGFDTGTREPVVSLSLGEGVPPHGPHTRSEG